jgi:hypothetical protein
MLCRQCGTEIADKAIVCYRCGTATAEPRLTPAARRRRRPPLPVTVAFILILILAALAIGPATPEGAPRMLFYALAAVATFVVVRMLRR